MRLSTFIQRTRALGDLKVPTHVIDTLGDRIAEGADLASVLKHRNTTLTARVLLGIWRAARILQRHLASLDQVTERRRKAGLPIIPPAVLKQTVAAHEVVVLERAEALSPPGSVAEHRRRDAIKEAVALWKACLAIAHREGQIEVKLATEDPALIAEFGELVEKANLGEIKPHRWMAIRRGVDSGALDLQLDVPTDRLLDQMKARGTELAALAHGEKAPELLQRLVLVDLDEWALALKDEAARGAAYRNAATAYLNLLAAPRPKAALAAGIALDADAVAVAIVARDGSFVAGDHAPLGEAPLATVERLIGGHPVELIVLPTRGGDAEQLNALARGFTELFEVIRVKPNALRQAVAAEQTPAAEPVARAAALARRALTPRQAWGQLDPTHLGLAEYQQDLDEAELRAWLDDMRVMAALGVQPEDLARPAPQAKVAKVAAKPLNPLIKSLDDLRPGLMVNGLITNITQFGAFVNIGLAHEGLVHVSELADHFVNDPNEVVRVGQPVEARVLGVDRARRRISLSLRAEREAGAPRAAEGDEAGGRRRERLDDIPGRRGGGGGAGFERRPPGPGGNATGASRAQALAELEALFNANKK